MKMNIKARIQRNIYCLITNIKPEWNIKLRYKAMYKKHFPDNNPTTFVEKLLWLRLHVYNNSSLVDQCADKVTVRDYVKTKGYGKLLNECLGIYDSVEEIPWDSLPNQFAIKWNFGATFNIICDDKRKLNINEVKTKLTQWGRIQYHLPFAEMQYKHCKKKIIIEKYLDTNQGFLPYDFKFYCFDGVCKAILFIADRENSDSKKGAFFDEKWNYLGVPMGGRYHEFNTIPQKPSSYEDMLKCAEELSKGIPFVRMDFYDYNGKAIFGEMTFTPTAGFSPAQILIDGHDMGDFINLSISK